jgi:toxin ParE1/3/4
MGKVRWTLEAARWLQDIRDYIAQDDPDAANRVVRGIYEKTSIAAAVSRNRICARDPTRPSYPRSIARPLHIAYLIKPDGTIDILGVFHGSLDIDRYL